MERKLKLAGLRHCCCCAEPTHRDLVINIDGDESPICLGCAEVMSQAYAHKNVLFADPANPPVMLLEKSVHGVKRFVMLKNEVETRISYDETVGPHAGKINYTAVDIGAEEAWDKMMTVINEKFDQNPILHHAFNDYNDIAQRMAVNTVGNETEAELRALLFHSWKTVAVENLEYAIDNMECNLGTMNNQDMCDFARNQIGVPYPNEEAIMTLYHLLLRDPIIQNMIKQNAKWQAEQAKRPDAYDEEE